MWVSEVKETTINNYSSWKRTVELRQPIFLSNLQDATTVAGVKAAEGKWIAEIIKSVSEYLSLVNEQ
jgi:hypothetical protein